jgi:hypothetical protein
LEVEGLPATARDTLRTVYVYLERHREHIDYAAYKALGLPLGSGMVESACKWLIQQRFKGVGMRWSEEGFNHLLHLRLAWVNGRVSKSPFSHRPVFGFMMSKPLLLCPVAQYFQ